MTLVHAVYVGGMRTMNKIQKFIEVPNTNIKEPVLNNQWADELCLQIADDYGYAEIVWYALNGKRVVEGNYGDPKLVGIDENVLL